MYRIRLTTGEEAVYRTVEELARAVKFGVVSPEAEVFHKAGNRWLPIHMHPDYQAAVGAAAQTPRESKPAPLPTPGKGTAKPPTATAAKQEPPPAKREPAPVAPPPPPAPEPVLVAPVFLEPVAPALEAEAPPTTGREAPPPADPAPRSRRTPQSRSSNLRRILAMAGGLVAISTASLATYLALRSRPTPPSIEDAAEDTAPDAAAGMPPAPVQLMVPRVDSFTTDFPSPSPPLPLDTEEDGSAGAGAPGTRTSRLPATRGRTPSYAEAYAEARAQMDEGFAYVRFRDVFSASHLASYDSVRATRRMLAAASNIVRVYRGREVMLEQTYNPEDPGGRGSYRESFEVSESVRATLEDADSLLGVLLSQQGHYRFDGQGIVFEDRSAAGTYMEIRQRVLDQLRRWRDMNERYDRVTVPRVRQALAATPPPPAR